METTNCVFNPVHKPCRGQRRKNLNMLACDKHLLEFYGLEVDYIVHETEVSFKFVGGKLKPAKGKPIEAYTVIIPTEKFFDNYRRPEDHINELNDVHAIHSTLDYKLNPTIIEFLRNKGTLNKNESNAHIRYGIEMIRNFTNTAANSGPTAIQNVLLSNLISLIHTKKESAHIGIQNKPIHANLGYHMVNVHNEKDEIEATILKELDVSKSMQYLLLNCYFSDHALDNNGLKFTDSIQYNCVWMKDVGLVATEDIADPNFLIVDGVSVGSQQYYNAYVATVKKNIIDKSVSLNSLPSQFYLSDAFRGGSEDCLA